MKKLLAATATSILVAGTASANCVGSGSISACYDANTGNTYTVNRIGNTTYMQGSNANGSTWNQNSINIGNHTFHSGTSSSGNSWNSTTSRYGNTVHNHGTNARGQSFSSTCIGDICY